MATFTRGEFAKDEDEHSLVNIASDVQINHMVATYFEQCGYTDIRQQPEIVHSMWWEPDERCWDGSLITLSAKNPSCLTLREACRKLLPDGRFRSIDEVSMEWIFNTLKLFDKKADP